MPPETSKRRWAVLSHEYSPGLNGSAKTGTFLAQELARRGHDIVVLTRTYPEAPAGVTHQDGIEVRRYEPTTWRWWHLPHAQYRRDLGRLRVDAAVLLHQNTWMSNQAVDLWPKVPARRAYLPIEFDPETSKGFSKPWVHRFWNRTLNHRLMTTSHLVAGVTQPETRALRGFLGDAARVSHVPLGLDPTAFDPPAPDALTRRWNDLPTDFVLHASSRQPNKRRGLAVDVARGPGHDLPWVFAGAGSDEVRLPNADGLGFVEPDELVALYGRARVHLQTSSAEGFGYTLLESLAQGTPFVAGPVGLAPALAAQGGGLLVDETPGLDGRDLVDRFGRALHDAYRRPRDPDRLRAIARQYSWPETVDRLESLVFDDASKRPTPS